VSRDHEKLKVFGLADELAVETYRCTSGFPAAERWGLRVQLRRAAVSVPTNIVEGCARQSRRDYLHFLGIARGSASEARYLVSLAGRLGLLDRSEAERIASRYGLLLRSLQALVNALREAEPRSEA
jgi:four helix bundle protein